MTMNAWDNASRLAEKHTNQGGLFVRLGANGDKVVGAFCGEPFAREVVWTGERYEVFDPATHADKRPSLRVMINFFVTPEDDMKVIEGGTVWFKDVLKVRNKYGLDKWLFEIERHGDAGDPKTSYSILPEERIDEGMRTRIGRASEHDLAAIASGDGIGTGEKSPSRPTAPAAPTVDLRTASEIVARLKALPRSDVDAFLRELGVERVRELKVSDLPTATRLLERLETQQRQRLEDDSIDPFA